MRDSDIYLSIGLLVFAVIGITLDHAPTMTAEPFAVSQRLEILPELPRDEQGQPTESPELA